MSSEPPPVEAAKTQPMPVAFCITELDPGGAERALFETVTRLDRSEWTPKVFCLGPDTPLAERFRTAGIEVVCYSAMSIHLLPTIWRLRRDLRTFRPSVLTTSLFHANFVGRLAAIGLGIPVIAGHRVAERRAHWHLALERLTGRWVDHHLVVSESVRSFLISERIATESNSTVIYNGVDIDRFRSAQPVEYDAPGPIVLFVGRLSPQKGLEILFDAWPKVVREFPLSRLLIAGVGPLGELVHAQAASPNIDFVGFQPDVAPWYARTDLVVLPSRWEGLPNVLLESLAAATPCLVAKVEGVVEVLGPNSPMIVEPCDSDTLAERIIASLRDSDIVSAAALSAQSIVEKKFTWQATAESLTLILRSCVKTRR